MVGHEQIWVLLHQVEGPVNLGSVCRAMANTGFGQLRFSGELTAADPEAVKYAVHAGSLLHEARKCNGIESLIEGLDFVFGFTPRSPWSDGRDLDLDRFHEVYREVLEKGRSIGLLFGNEAHGLANRDLAVCHYRIALPTDSDYTSMNLAQAVMVVLWELKRKHGNQPPPANSKPDMATTGQIRELIANLRRFLDTYAFLNPQNPDLLWREIMTIFKTREWSQRELKILHAIFAKARARYLSLEKKHTQIKQKKDSSR